MLRNSDIRIGPKKILTKDQLPVFSGIYFSSSRFDKILFCIYYLILNSQKKFKQGGVRSYVP